MSRSKYLLTTLLMSTLFSGCGEQQSQVHTPSAVDVSVVTVVTAPLPLVSELQGRTKASLTAEVRPQVAGIIRAQLFKEGAYVKQGQGLYQIEDDSYQAALSQAKANLHNANATLTAAMLKDKRYQELVAVEGVSQQDAEAAHASYLEALSSVSAYEAAVKTAAISLARTKVTAPISGYVGISTVTVGALVTAEQDTALTSINCLDPIYVDVTESSKAILTLKRAFLDGKLDRHQMPVSLLLEDGLPYDLTGELMAQEVAVDTATGSVTLRASFANPKQLLLPGMFVRARFAQAQAAEGIVVPQQGVAHDNSGAAYVLLVNDQQQVVHQTVTLGDAIDDTWIVTAGLKAGDQLIVEGSGKVTPGQTVVAHPFTSASKPQEQ